jgi:UDP-N-acetylmuramate--alanine ligase
LFAGIGGAGMSGLAVVTRAWGADVSGWDRVRTPYLEHLPGIEVTIAPDPPEPPRGAEVVVSTAFAQRVDGKPRGEPAVVDVDLP